MKKLLYIITVFLYVTMACGVVINLHYCMGRYQSFDLYTAQKNECGKCGMPMDKSHGCCKDEVKIVKLQDDQNTSTVSYTIKNVEAPTIIPSDFIEASAITPDKLQKQEDHSPPELSNQDIYLNNCVFRI
jgi:hypothetical protein